MKNFLNYSEIFSPNENFKNSSFPPLFLPPLILKNFSSPQILLSSKIQLPSFTMGRSRYVYVTAKLQIVEPHGNFNLMENLKIVTGHK